MPQNRNGYCDEYVVRFLRLYSRTDAYLSRNMIDFAFLAGWGDVYETDIELIDIGFHVVDNMKSEQTVADSQNKNGLMKVNDPFSV